MEVLALILERLTSKDVSGGFQTTFSQADESDTEGGYIFTEGKVWEQIRSDILRNSLEHPDSGHLNIWVMIPKYLGYDT